jgi:hypothetical protein
VLSNKAKKNGTTPDFRKGNGVVLFFLLICADSE